MGKTIYETITKKCPVCSTEFTTKKGHKREKMTCSYSCSNTFFRSGENNPNYRHGHKKTYRNLVKYEKCERCGYSDYPVILQVHHRDHNHQNNDPSNLEVLCPNCHCIEHYVK